MNHSIEFGRSSWAGANWTTSPGDGGGDYDYDRMMAVVMVVMVMMVVMVVCRQDLKSRLGQGGRCQLLLLLQSTKVKLLQTIPKQEYEYNVVLLSQAGHLSRS